jgi:ketosteroid isomerase-like protein
LKRSLVFISVALVTSFFATGGQKKDLMQEELLRIEKDFSQAITANDAEAIGRFLADEWIIIDPDGGIIDKTRFLEVIKSGALTHELMESDNARVRIYGDSAVVTALTTTKGTFSGQPFTTRERATDVFVKEHGHWHCVLSQLTRLASK